VTSLDFKRTTKGLGASGSAYVSAGYQRADGTDVWEDVPMTTDRARLDVPDDTKTFVVRCQITGAAGGGVELEVKNGDKILKPSFKREVRPTDAGRTFLAYRVYTL
jgi:hypothetical protein